MVLERLNVYSVAVWQQAHGLAPGNFHLGGQADVAFSPVARRRETCTCAIGLNGPFAGSRTINRSLTSRHPRGSRSPIGNRPADIPGMTTVGNNGGACRSITPHQSATGS